MTAVLHLGLPGPFCRANELGVSQPINNIRLRDQLRALMRAHVKV